MSWFEYLRWVLAVLNLAACVWLWGEIRRWQKRTRELNGLIDEMNAHRERYMR